ncbi:MAG: carboxypeptidase regulatory-like domain-containing protein, partial [Thermodesulfovibrionales bacterium]
MANISKADFEGTIGTRFTISGNGFGTKKPMVYVEYEKTPGKIKKVGAKVESWDDVSVTCLWTKKLPARTYNLFVQPKIKGAAPISAGVFSIMNPSIEDVAPTTWASGDLVTIYGKFFSTKKPQVYLEEPTTLKRNKCKVLKSVMDSGTGVSSLQFLVPQGGLDAQNIILKNTLGNDKWGSVSKVLKVVDSGVYYYNNLIVQGSASGDALVNTIDWYKAQPSVVDSYLAVNDQNIFVEDITGITTLFITSDTHLSPPGTTSSLTSKFDKTLKSITSSVSSVSGPKALIMDPYGLDNAKVVKNLLDSKIGSDNVEYLIGGQVWPGEFAKLSDYDLIYYVGHGAVNKDGIIGICTGEKFSQNKLEEYNKEIRTMGKEPLRPDGRQRYIYQCITAAHEDTFGITSDFIADFSCGEEHPCGMDNSKRLKATAVYFDTCHSIETDNMAKAFIDNGAKSYLGWDRAVEAILTSRLAESFFEDLLNCNGAETAYNNLFLPYAASCKCITTPCYICIPLPDNLIAELIPYYDNNYRNAKLPSCSTSGGVHGKLHVDSASGVALAGATVTCGGKTTTTGSDGTFSLSEILAGSQTLSFTKSGYQAYSAGITITAGENYDAGDRWLVFNTPIPTLLIDGGTSSTKQQGGTFVTSGSHYTPNSAVTRYMRNPDGST